MDSIAPVMDSIAPSTSRLDPVNLPSSYEEAVHDNITQKVESYSSYSELRNKRRGVIYKANKSPIIIYKFIELFLQYFTGNIMLQVTGTVPPYSLVLK